MSRDIAAKLAAGEELDEDEIQYARDRGMALPEEYGEGAADTAFDPTTGHVVSSGDFGGPPEEEAAEYSDMTKADLRAEADSRGLDVASDATKAEIVAALEEDDEAGD